MMSEPFTLNPRFALPERIRSLPRVGSRATDQQIEVLRRAGRTIMPLTAYPARPHPAHVLEAAAAAAHSLEHPPAAGLLDLRVALADLWQQRSGRPFAAESEILISCGAMHALLVCFMAILNPGDEVLLPTPAYFFDGSVILAGGVLRRVPFSAQAGFAWDVEALAAAIGPRTRAILLNTPTNPTGVVASRETLEQIAELAESRGLFIVCDESYDRLVYDGQRHVSVLECVANREQMILVGSFTKSFGLANWRVGYSIAPREVTQAMLKVLEWTMLYGPLVNQRVAESVLRNDLSWLDGLCAEFQANRDRMAGILSASPWIDFNLPQGNPFFFLDFRSTGATDDQACAYLLNQHGVPTTAGHLHGLPGYLRVAFGGESHVVEQAAQRLVLAAEELHQGRRV